jgi:protein TonB
MKTALSFTSVEFLMMIIGVVVFLLLLVVLTRRYLRMKAASDLGVQHAKRVGDLSVVLRKYPEVDVFRWTGSFFQLALVLVLVVVIGVFNLTTYERRGIIPMGALDIGEMDIEVEPPRSAEQAPPPPPPPPPLIQEVPNEIVLEQDNVEFLDQSVEAETAIEAPVVVAERKAVAPPPPPPPPPMEHAVEEIFKVVEEMPRFPGCEHLATTDERRLCADQKMLQFIYDNIEYPGIARENGIEGTVVVRFVVDADGKISQIEVVRDIGGQCGDEALRVVKLMNEMPERWAPGKQRGKPVRVWFNLPVKFILEYN